MAGSSLIRRIDLIGGVNSSTDEPKLTVKLRMTSRSSSRRPTLNMPPRWGEFRVHTTFHIALLEKLGRVTHLLAPKIHLSVLHGHLTPDLAYLPNWTLVLEQ